MCAVLLNFNRVLCEKNSHSSQWFEGSGGVQSHTSKFKICCHILVFYIFFSAMCALLRQSFWGKLTFEPVQSDVI